jgi:hypothetical protein
VTVLDIAAARRGGWTHLVRNGHATHVPVQDDSREQQAVALFNLTVAADRGRSDVDAYLKLAELPSPLPFELKSSTTDSVSTVRDFGPEHIAKWRHMHWIFAMYKADGTTLRHCYYASPGDMRDWIEEKEQYVRPDMLLAQHAPDLISDAILNDILGADDSFDIGDARLIMKNQWRAVEYQSNADLPGGRFSRERMVVLLRHRLAYVVRRGATLNNPHIPERYFAERELPRITEDHAATLRRLVREYIAEGAPAAPIDPAIAAQAKAAETDLPTA